MEEYTVERFEPSRFVKSHQFMAGGQTIAFDSISEDCVFYGEDGKAEASIFSISYLRKDTDGKRPVMFFWNGGPGSATSTLHLECFGPWLIQTEEGKPRYGLVENPESLLELCDLVFVDPVGVGYSRLLNPEKRGKYFSVDGDARSIAFFIAEWIRRNGRWNCPLYLCGESYGTVRACRVLAELGRSPYSESRKVLGIQVAGVILIGSAISMKPDGRLLEDGIELVTAMMPAMAATNWYHHPEGKKPQAEFVEEAWNFAKTELLSALFEGEDCPDERIAKDAKKLAEYTGMSEEYFRKTRLRLLSEQDFCVQTASDLGCRVDIYDSRVKIPLQADYNPVGNADNVPLAVMNGLLAPRLGIAFNRLYYTGNLTVYPDWDFDTEDLGPGLKKTHMGCLKAAMEANPAMETLFASGLYDLCTHVGNTRYALAHSGLPKERTIVREYPGGHGVYSSEEGKTRLMQDIRAMLERQGG
ncbi:MAG: hypothetical protein Q4F41_02365 [Eubacteriales bacterium]|nr:hypothetical protein [Eubacteriales bacterium]